MIQVASSGTPGYLGSLRRRGIRVVSSGGGGGTFSPANMTGIQGWYDFSTLALTDGTAIASLPDGSANGRNLSQATGTKQPLCKTGANGINGLAVALFDGVDDFLQSGASAVNQPLTVYAILTNAITGSSGQVWASADGSLSVRAGWTPGIGPSEFAGSVVTGNDVTGGPHTVTWVINGASSLIRVNGVQNVTGNPGANNQSNGITLGGLAGSIQCFGGKLGELMWTNSATVDTAAEAYLKAKWGTP